MYAHIQINDCSNFELFPTELWPPLLFQRITTVDPQQWISVVDTETHEVYTVAFVSHLFQDLFPQNRELLTFDLDKETDKHESDISYVTCFTSEVV